MHVGLDPGMDLFVAKANGYPEAAYAALSHVRSRANQIEPADGHDQTYLYSSKRNEVYQQSV